MTPRRLFGILKKHFVIVPLREKSPIQFLATAGNVGWMWLRCGATRVIQRVIELPRLKPYLRIRLESAVSRVLRMHLSDPF